MNTAQTTTAAAPVKLHPFYATLGEGPYSFQGCYDLGAALDPKSAANFGNMTGWLRDSPRTKNGLGSCAHCGQGIMLICLVKTGNGDLYGIGSDCVEKCSTGGIWRGAKAALALRRQQQARERRQAKAAAQWEAERPAREAALATHLAKARIESDANQAKLLARIEAHHASLTAMAGQDTLEAWKRDYTSEVAPTFNYQGAFSPTIHDNDFGRSLAAQYIAHGYLSERQAYFAAKMVLGRPTKKNQDAFDALAATFTAQ